MAPRYVVQQEEWSTHTCYVVGRGAWGYIRAAHAVCSPPLVLPIGSLAPGCLNWMAYNSTAWDFPETLIPLNSIIHRCQGFLISSLKSICFLVRYKSHCLLMSPHLLRKRLGVDLICKWEAVTRNPFSLYINWS